MSCVFGGHPPELALLVVLLAGHVFGDFLLQTQRVADAKEHSTPAMLAHGVLVLVGHLVVIAPIWTWPAAALMVVLSVLHTATDAVRVRIRGSGSLPGFVVDQAVHAGLVVAAWLLLTSRDGWTAGAVTQAWFLPYAGVLAVASTYVFNGRGGTAIVRKTLSRYPRIAVELESDERDEYEMGKVIGNLERFLILTLILFWQWGAIGLVIAAKSIARFPELSDRQHKDFTEYYLIGTLTSILVAIGSAIVLRGVLTCFSQ